MSKVLLSRDICEPDTWRLAQRIEKELLTKQKDRSITPYNFFWQITLHKTFLFVEITLETTTPENKRVRNTMRTKVKDDFDFKHLVLGKIAWKYAETSLPPDERRFFKNRPLDANKEITTTTCSN